jgi:hypothetical protein
VCADWSCHPTATIHPLSEVSITTISITTARLREDRLLRKRISAVHSVLHFNSTLTTSYGLPPPCERAGVGVGCRPDVTREYRPRYCPV